MDNPKQMIRLPVKGHKQVRGVILFSFIFFNTVDGPNAIRRSSYAAAIEDDNITTRQLPDPLDVEEAHYHVSSLAGNEGLIHNDPKR